MGAYLRHYTVYNVSFVIHYAVIFDPASFYGHHEFDLAIPEMYSGFNEQFYDAYHGLIPKAPGFAMRHKLYILFNYINHW
jgi:fructosamine-3-kinase